MSLKLTVKPISHPESPLLRTHTIQWKTLKTIEDLDRTLILHLKTVMLPISCKIDSHTTSITNIITQNNKTWHQLITMPLGSFLTSTISQNLGRTPENKQWAQKPNEAYQGWKTSTKGITRIKDPVQSQNMRWTRTELRENILGMPGGARKCCHQREAGLNRLFKALSLKKRDWTFLINWTRCAKDWISLKRDSD